MAEKNTDESGPVRFRHIRDGRVIDVRSNATKQIAAYEDHPNWKREK